MRRKGDKKLANDERLALHAETRTFRGWAWLRDHAEKEGAGGKPGHVARGPYRVVSTDSPTVLLDVDDEHRRDDEAHVVRAFADTFDVVSKLGASHHVTDVLSCATIVATTDDIHEDTSCLAFAETANGLLMGRYTRTDTPEAV